jgi:hypothetical protein
MKAKPGADHSELVNFSFILLRGGVSEAIAAEGGRRCVRHNQGATEG